MLENINLKKKLSREEYKSALPFLQQRLYDLEKACWDNKYPTIIVFEGWDASGKGEAISAITQRLDPRGFRIHSIGPPRTHEQQYAWLWRFWLKVPNGGEMLMFDHSWYGRVLEERVEKAVPNNVWRQAYRDIVDFERMLADDGTTILKFFLHISKKEQKKRFRAFEADALESWRVTAEDWARHKRYKDYLVATEQMFEQTDSEYAPWVIIEATSGAYARKKILDTLIATLDRRLGPKAPPRNQLAETSRRDADLRAVMESLEKAQV